MLALRVLVYHEVPTARRIFLTSLIWEGGREENEPENHSFSPKSQTNVLKDRPRVLD